MNDFPSLSDLSSKTGSVPLKKPAGLKIASDETAEKFKKKMSQVALKQKEAETMRFAQSIGFPHIDLEKFPVSQKALEQLRREDVEKAGAVCFFYANDEFRIGALDPRRADVAELVSKLEEKTQGRGLVYVISQHSFDRVLEMYDRLPTVKPITKDITVKEEDLKKVRADIKDFKQLQSLLKKTSTTDLVIFLLGVSLKLGASDLHIEAEESGIAIRLRLDGVLYDAANLDKKVFKRLASRVKLIAGLKINITDKPQDGRFTIKLSAGDVDVRVSTMPTYYGESIVMRLLPQKREGLSFDEIGLTGGAHDRLKREIQRPNGMIITTGPTGSGKTTTLYAIMHLLNKPGVKIITMEDPVEYRMEGLNQSQVDNSRGYTFAKGLKSILRQDPDIAMVGEIRDLETAEIAVQAALTGHLLLSTIHTNSAAGAIPRFLSMGVKPFLLPQSLNAVIGQRLVRKICPDCRREHKLTQEERERVENIISGMPDKERDFVSKKELAFKEGAGCEACHGLGYKGRTAIYEILIMSEQIKQMVLSGRISEFEIEKAAISEGMVTMVQDGILKALDGITSLEEVFRVIE